MLYITGSRPRGKTMASLYEMAENMISDEAKEQWLRKYLSDPDNMDKFMSKWLEKSVAENIKRTPGKKAPEKIGKI